MCSLTYTFFYLFTQNGVEIKKHLPRCLESCFLRGAYFSCGPLGSVFTGLSRAVRIAN